MSAMARPLAMPAIVPVSATVGHRQSFVMGTHTTPSVSPSTVTPTAAVVVVGVATATCRDTTPSVSLQPSALPTAVLEGGDTQQRGGRAALAWGWADASMECSISAAPHSTELLIFASAGFEASPLPLGMHGESFGGSSAWDTSACV